MPRDSNGNYTLPAGNPVVTGTTIETAWANPTMDDIKQALTDSLDRYGRGGMQAPFRFVDGTAGAPGMSWASELSTGFYRAGAADMRATIAGVPQMRWTGTGVDVWDSANNQWLALTTGLGANFALLNATNKFTATQQIIVNTTGAWSIWKDGTPTLAARFAFNNTIADGIDLSIFNGTDWTLKYSANAAQSVYYNDTHQFRTSAGSASSFAITPTSLASYGGRSLFTFGANDVTYAKFSVDSNGAGYWNSDASLVGYQWYQNNILTLSMRYGGTPNRTVIDFPGSGTNEYGIIKTSVAGGAIRWWGDGSTVNRGLDIGGVDNAGNFTRYIQLGDVIGGQIAFTANLDMYFGKNIRFFDSTNSSGYTMYMPDGGATKSPSFVSFGAVLYNANPAFARGDVNLGTTVPGATGGVPGSIWLVY